MDQDNSTTVETPSEHPERPELSEKRGDQQHETTTETMDGEEMVEKVYEAAGFVWVKIDGEAWLVCSGKSLGPNMPNIVRLNTSFLSVKQ